MSRSCSVLVAAAFACCAPVAFAQNAPPSLEDLIPDSAVENPEEWAQTLDDTAQGEAPLAQDSELDLPMDELPDMAVEWPDDIELPEVEPLAPDSDVEFVELEDDRETPVIDTETRRVDEQIVLAFPAEVDRFPLQSEFVERFESLSTIEELGGDTENIAQLAARARADQELLQELLRSYGYYDGQVLRTVGAIRPGEDVASEVPQVRFDILPGARYRYGSIDLGELDTAPDAELLRAAFEIQSGDEMSNFRIVEEQADLDTMLGESGYAFAEIDAPELLVDHERQEGDLTMPVRPNGKYAFGPVISNLSGFLSSEHLADIARFDMGDTYRRSLEQDLRRAITATGLVSSVSITVRETEAPGGDEMGTVALDVELTPAELRTIAGAIGYGSQEGIRVQASWEHRNLFPPEGSLRVRGIAGTQEQLFGVTFRKNNFTGRDKVLTIDAYASTIDSDAFDANTVSVIGTFERASTLLFQKPLSWSVGLEAVATDERPAAIGDVVRPRQTYFVGAIPLYALIDTTDDLLDPTQGWRLGGRLSPEISRTQGAQSFYLRSQIDASYYQEIGEGKVIAGRVRAASIPGTALINIAPSRRLYAGGGGSVRGYGYQFIGPRDEFGDPSGGRSLIEVSLEARIRTGYFDGALSVVPFIDAGTVGVDPTPDFDEIRFGAGVGVRYHTGFGPIRVDVATPINPGPDDSPIAVYVSLGQAF